MKAFAIVLEGNAISEQGFQILVNSAPFSIKKFSAVVPHQVDAMLAEYNIYWNYPLTGEYFDEETGLLKTAYAGRDYNKLVACFLSHYTLWRLCSNLDESFIIFEHDAIFCEKELSIDSLEASVYSIIGLNNPIGATRKAQDFLSKLINSTGIIPVPKIDKDIVPQGLAGNSAYYLKPKGAKMLLTLVDKYGAWPNDAIMCQQLLPNELGVTTKMYTKVQGLLSTTKL